MWFFKPPISKDKHRIEELLDRATVAVYPSREFLEERLLSGKRLRLYLGIDPTGPTLHLGHFIALRKLRAFQDLGHEVILLIGDFTAMIGDPTDKSAARKRLSRSEVLANASLYRSQASKVLSFDGENKAKLRYNSTWLSRMKFEDVLNLAAHMTVDQMQKRDMFMRRAEEGKPVYLHEFLYPLLQGYDSVAMDVDGEIGGNDQTFNMLAGRSLVKDMLDKEKFVLTLKLLEDPSGKKMGKTEGNMITFHDSPEEMVGKVMSWTDGMIIPGFELCTGVPMQEIKRLEESMKEGANPRDVKLRLAEEITAAIYGIDAAHRAAEAFIRTFSEGEIPENIPEERISKGTSLGEALKGHVSSKSELRRLVASHAVSGMTSKEVFIDVNQPIEKGDTIRIGKKKFVRIIVD